MRINAITAWKSCPWTAARKLQLAQAGRWRQGPGRGQKQRGLWVPEGRVQGVRESRRAGKSSQIRQINPDGDWVELVRDVSEEWIPSCDWSGCKGVLITLEGRGNQFFAQFPSWKRPVKWHVTVRPEKCARGVEGSCQEHKGFCGSFLNYVVDNLTVSGIGSISQEWRV